MNRNQTGLTTFKKVWQSFFYQDEAEEVCLSPVMGLDDRLKWLLHNTQPRPRFESLSNHLKGSISSDYNVAWQHLSYMKARLFLQIEIHCFQITLRQAIIETSAATCKLVQPLWPNIVTAFHYHIRSYQVNI